MFMCKSINAEHKDLIHDVAYDFYGRRMATCSSDQYVKIWDLNEDGQWTCSANWKTHTGSVWKVTWAHPEFGQVIATCSFDRTASVWEEIIGESGGSERSQSHWVKRTNLVDSRTSVTDVKFAPKHQGFQLATCSADGVVRVYEAVDVTNLSQWSLTSEVQCKLSCSSLTWNPSKMNPPMIAVGSDDNNPSMGGKVLIYEFNEGSRRWSKVETVVSINEPVRDIAFAPCLGRGYHLLAVAAKDVHIILLKPMQREVNGVGTQTTLSRFEVRQAAQFDEHNSIVWRVCWNITGTILSSSGDDGCIRLWKANYLDIWKCIATIKGDGLNVQPDPPSATGSQANVSGSYKYYKVGNMDLKGQAVWH